MRRLCEEDTFILAFRVSAVCSPGRFAGICSGSRCSAGARHRRHRFRSDLRRAGSFDDDSRLALFYGGMVRTKNILGTLAQSFVMAALISVQWVLFGYSIAFGP